MKIVDIPVRHIEPDPDNPNVMPERTYAALREDISTRGFVQPLLVRPIFAVCPECGEERDDQATKCPHCATPAVRQQRYRLVDGEHRWTALFQLGADTAPCVIETGDATDAQLRMVTMNRLRGRFVPIRLAHLLRDLSERITPEQLGQRLALDRNALEDYLSLASYLEPEVERPRTPSGEGGGAGVELAFVAKRELADRIQRELDRLTGGHPDREVAAITKAARAYGRSE